MGARCTICRLPQDQLEILNRTLLTSGKSIKKIAARDAHGLSRYALRRHKLSHISAAEKARYLANTEVESLKDCVVAADEKTLHHYAAARSKIYRIEQRAEEDGDNELALRALRVLHENLLHTSKLTGELRSGPMFTQNNMILNADASRTLAEIVAAVGPDPIVRRNVIAAMRRLETPVIDGE
jgi:hypothetical protein